MHYEAELAGLMLGEVGSGCPAGTVFYPEANACIPIKDQPHDIPTDPAAPKPAPGFVAPGAVPVRADNWDLSVQPAIYTIAPGDTYTGLAATYLDNGARWREIWDMNRSVHPNPDQIQVGDRIKMPDEAKRKFQKKARKIPMWAMIAGGAAVALIGYKIAKG